MNPEKTKQILRAMKAFVKKDPRFNINELRIIVAIERAVARLAHRRALDNHLIFKGGYVLLKSYESQRFTRDVDALAIDISKTKLKDDVCTAFSSDLDDGVWFGDIQVQELTEQGEYGAYRFDCAFQIGEPDLKKLHKFSRIHLDVGFSDKLLVKPANQIMPSLLEYEEPITWKVYPIEYIIAEKLQTFFDRGSTNSRAKDIYDLVYLFPRCQSQQTLISTIKRTFENRGAILPESCVKQASQFDKLFLESAWPGIKVLDKKMTFNEAWEMLMNHLKDLDKILKE